MNAMPNPPASPGESEIVSHLGIDRPSGFGFPDGQGSDDGCRHSSAADQQAISHLPWMLPTTNPTDTHPPSGLVVASARDGYRGSWARRSSTVRMKNSGRDSETGKERDALPNHLRMGMSASRRRLKPPSSCIWQMCLVLY